MVVVVVVDDDVEVVVVEELVVVIVVLLLDDDVLALLLLPVADEQQLLQLWTWWWWQSLWRQRWCRGGGGSRRGCVRGCRGRGCCGGGSGRARVALVLVVGLVAVVVVAIVVVIVVVVVVVGFVDVVAATQPQLPASCTWAHPRVHADDRDSRARLQLGRFIMHSGVHDRGCLRLRVVAARLRSGPVVPCPRFLLGPCARNARGAEAVTRHALQVGLVEEVKHITVCLLLEKRVDVHLLHGVWARSHAATWCAVRLAILCARRLWFRCAALVVVVVSLPCTGGRLANHFCARCSVVRWHLIALQQLLLLAMRGCGSGQWHGSVWCLFSCTVALCTHGGFGNFYQPQKLRCRQAGSHWRSRSPWCWLFIRHDRSMLISAVWCVVARHGAAPLGHGHATGPSVGTACHSARTCARPIDRCAPLIARRGV